jgi:ABC-type bacteriocin/lantibiotic exporter with double-glycine peptidase domain
MLTLLLAVLELTALITGFFTDFFVLASGTREGRRLRAIMARRILHAMSNRRNEVIVNSYISRVRADVDVIEQYHKVSRIPSFAALVQVALSLALAAMLSIAMTGVLVCEVAVILLLVWLYSNLHARLSLNRLLAEEQLGKGAQLYMRAALAIWFGRIGSLWLRHRFRDARALARARLRYGVGAVAYHNLTAFSMGAFVVLGGFLIFRGTNSTAANENFFVLVLYSGFLLGPVTRLASFIPETREFRTAIARLLDESTEDGNFQSPFDALDLSLISIRWKRDTSKGQEDTLRFEATFRTGEKIAIVGESGSGKTTLFELLLGARESPDAHILFNGQSAVELSRVMLALSVVYLTDTALFESGTIEQNNVDRSAESIRFMKAVGLIEDEREVSIFLMRAIDRNGEPLSLGERQRVQLVRALLMRPRLLLMDEALSGIAEEAEGRIVKWLITDELRDITIVYASHRPAIQALFPKRFELKSGIKRKL